MDVIVPPNTTATIDRNASNTTTAAANTTYTSQGARSENTGRKMGLSRRGLRLKMGQLGIHREERL